MSIIIVSAIALAGVCVVSYAAVCAAAPKTKEEKRYDDDAQMEYIKNWKEKHC